MLMGNSLNNDSTAKIDIAQDVVLGKDNYSSKPTGYFKVYEVHKNNTESVVFEDVLYEGKNLVVNAARKIMRDLMLNDDSVAGPNKYRITNMKFGNKGHLDNNILVAVPPKLTDTRLNQTDANQIYSKVANRVGLGDTSIVYTVTLLNEEANLTDGTFAITEAGLFTGNNELFARKTFPVLAKTNTRSFRIEWTINF